MKKIYAAASITLCCVVFCLNCYSQSCAPANITTNPSAPVNTQVPSKVNTFNWLNTTYPVNSIYSTPSNNQIYSPFYQIDNSIINHFLTSLDMKPEDGWELIKRDFGYDDNNQPTNPQVDNPYLLLYNKYSGTFRIFVARGGSASFNGARIKMRFIDGSPMQTSLLDLSGTLAAINEAFVRNKIFNSVSQFNNEQFKWFYADFPMQYDPCTCFYTSKLLVEVMLINSSAITLEGSIEGNLTSIQNNQGTVDQPSSSFSFGELVGAGKKASESYKSVNDFINKQKAAIDKTIKDAATSAAKKQSLTNLQNAMKTNGFLKTGLAAAPWISAAVSLVDFFVGGGKKDDPSNQELKLSPMAIDMTAKLSGTITAEYRYKDITFWNPGSNNTTQTLSEYPYYNEVMGVFNIIYRPQGTMKITIDNDYSTGYQTRYYKYRVSNPIQYVINPAAGLTLQEAKVALVAEGDSVLPYTPNGDFYEVEGKNVLTGKWQYRTPYVNANCFDENIFEHVSSNEPNMGPIWLPTGTYYLKFLLNFSRTNNPSSSQNVLLVAKYPITFTSGTIPASGTCSGSVFTQMSSSAITTYCQSTAYSSSTRFRALLQDTKEEDRKNVVKLIGLYPNPANNQCVLSFDLTTTSNINIYVTDIVGRKISTIVPFNRYQAGNHRQIISTANFPSGLYNVIVEEGTRKTAVKMVVIRN